MGQCTLEVLNVGHQCWMDYGVHCVRYTAVVSQQPQPQLFRLSDTLDPDELEIHASDKDIFNLLQPVLC